MSGMLRIGAIWRGAAQWLPRRMRVIALLLLAILPAACTQALSHVPAASTLASTCAPTDQDQFVYDPTRLQVMQSCIRVTGRIDGSWVATDGDTNILLRLDPPYQSLLTLGNSEGDEHGDLGVEAVCTLSPVDPIVIPLCASDTDPFVVPQLQIGAHVWMEGRYILDLNHASHAELHPLYRMGVLAS
jgi:hypothetical protein